MRLIVASQRVERLESRAESRDGLDQGWAGFCSAIGMGLVPIPNRLDSLDAWLVRLQPSAVILTGGNDVVFPPYTESACPDRDRTEKLLVEWAISERIPVLAVCHGFQFLNVFFGGRLSRLQGHVRTMHAIEWYPAIGDAPCPLVEVNSYHAFGIGPDDLAPCLAPLARSHDGSVEAAMHRTSPIIAIMWHPERAPLAQGPFLDFLRDHLSATS